MRGSLGKGSGAADKCFLQCVDDWLWRVRQALLLALTSGICLLYTLLVVPFALAFFWNLPFCEVVFFVRQCVTFFCIHHVYDRVIPMPWLISSRLRVTSRRAT